ncbi:MAG: hypothetical protein KKF16_07675 [Euryarchaeota archaeon]|nr:hypothetical protein [Euryarchaeota archaeon]MBU4607832.1 hypothetical protein [Euryarchaeota archaeon]MBV1728969.1 hypothetical protein [Methanobacterium sp.]MBV1754173.1 hypothetical protein [Methanobacterium sp.]
MDYQIFIIPLVVSLLFYILVSIIPFLFPQFVSNIFLSLPRKYSEDPVELQFLINQLVKNDSWKRLYALKLLEKNFQSKMKILLSQKEKEWKKELEMQKELLEYRGLSDDEILHIESGKKLKDKYGPDIDFNPPDDSIYYLNQYEEEFIKIRDDLQDEISIYREKYDDFKFWSVKNRNLLKFIQDKVFNNEELDLEKIAKGNREWSLLNLWGFPPKIKYNFKKIYYDIVLYVDLKSGEKEGEKVIKKLAIALSSHEKSFYYLEQFINQLG